jgi:hypothetical protein
MCDLEREFKEKNKLFIFSSQEKFNAQRYGGIYQLHWATKFNFFFLETRGKICS